MKPSYYDNFKCIADKCDFTCCQEWKIGVDEDTLNEWSKENAKELLACQDDYAGDKLSDYVTDTECGTVIKLCENRFCPFLNSNKLCNVVLKHGEEFISETCHTFPRESHEYEDHTEDTLMLCCPYVVDLLNEEKMFTVIDDNAKGELFDLRRKMISFIQEDGDIIENRLLYMFYILLECNEKDAYDKDLWLLVPELKNTIASIDINKTEILNECNELMLDLIDNYLKEGVYKKYLEAINEEALKVESILENSSDKTLQNEMDKYDTFLKTFDTYQKLMSKCLAQEFFGELIIDEEDMEGVLVKYQWIVMEYVLIRQFCYLHFRKNNSLEYSDVKQYMVIAFRIMGFDDDDIYEYLENSFEEVVWDFGYMSLLLD